MATREEVRQRVGEDLGLVPIGQDLENQDQLRIDAGIDEAYAFLKQKNVAAFALEGDIPDDVMPHFALFVAFRLCLSYSIPDSRYVRIVALAGPKGELALAKIAEVAVQEYDSTNDAHDF